MSPVRSLDTTEPPIHEAYAVGDTFVDGMPCVEAVGPCYRLTFTVTQTSMGDRERAVVARLIITPDVIDALANLGLSIAEAKTNERQTRYGLRVIN